MIGLVSGGAKGVAVVAARGITGAAVVLFASRPVQDDSNLRQVQALLAHPTVMCGRFEQSKSLVGLRRPVKSSGRFCVVVDKGVLWTTLLPFPATLRLTKDEIVESHGDQVTRRLSTRREPAVGMINDLLFSLLRGDLARLVTSFAITSAAEQRNWTAKLVPKEGGMHQVIGGIELSGGEFVRQITIREASGDRTDIAFSGIVTGPAALEPEEARQLDLPADGTSRPGGHDR